MVCAAAPTTCAVAQLAPHATRKPACSRVLSSRLCRRATLPPATHTAPPTHSAKPTCAQRRRSRERDARRARAIIPRRTRAWAWAPVSARRTSLSETRPPTRGARQMCSVRGAPVQAPAVAAMSSRSWAAPRFRQTRLPAHRCCLAPPPCDAVPTSSDSASMRRATLRR